MTFEAVIPFPRTLRGVSLVEPAVWLPSPGTPDRGTLKDQLDDLKGRLAAAEAAAAEAITRAAEAEAARAAAETQALRERGAVGSAVAALTTAAAELRKHQQQRLTEMQEAASVLAVEIASHLVHERIQSGNYAVEGLVQKVIARLRPDHAATVYLHPEDLKVLERRLDGEPLLTASGDDDVRLVADGSLARGDCRGEAGDVTVLYRLEEQIGDLRQHFRKSLPAAVERPAPAERPVPVEPRRKSEPPHLRPFPDRRSGIHAPRPASVTG